MTRSIGHDRDEHCTSFRGHLVILSSCHLVTSRRGRLACGFTILLAVLGVQVGCHKPGTASFSMTTPSTASDESQVPPWFQEITEQAGLNFIHDAGPLGQYFMPEMVGSGSAFF